MRFEESVKHIEIAKKAVKPGLVSVSNLPPKFKRQSPNPKVPIPNPKHKSPKSQIPLDFTH